MSTPRITSRAHIPPLLWDEAVARLDSAWLWHRADFQDSLCSWPGRRDVSAAALDDDGRILGLLPLHVTEERLGPIVVRRLDSFGGPTDPRSAAAGALWAYAESTAQSVGAIEITCSIAPCTPALRHWSGATANPLTALGLEDTANLCRIVDLAPGPEIVWQRMTGRARTTIRKAQRSGITVRASSGGADVETYHRLHETTFRRSGIQPHPETYSRAILTVHEPAGHAIVLFAEDSDGNAIAAASFAIFKNAAFYWTAAATDQGRRAGAPSLLIWEGIGEACRRGAEMLDIGDALPDAQDAKLRGLDDFKASFGGILTPHWRGRKDTAPLHLRLIRRSRKLALGLTRRSTDSR